MSTRTSNNVLVAAALLCLAVVTQTVMAQSSSVTATSSNPAQPQSAGQTLDDAAMNRQEILKTFQREAHAAYAQARQECQALSDAKEREICLAKARLQFDQDMRYAQKRADMGY